MPLTLFVMGTALAMLLVAFTLNFFEKVRNGGYSYSILNCLGGFILTYYAIEQNRGINIIK